MHGLHFERLGHEAPVEMPAAAADVAAALLLVVAHAENVRVGAGWMLVECGFRTPEPLADLDLNSTHVSQIKWCKLQAQLVF